MIFDVLLGLILIVIAWYAISSPDLLLAVVLYIALGLLAALVWTRMGAPDVAMAEAAVGSGLTGALLISTLSHLRRNRPKPEIEAERQQAQDETRTEPSEQEDSNIV
ncbi:MAG: DUF4040 domain-containing protein [Anaerolineaceae bacterium]|nr:MAG: DUF4040 domain-containing protein [Anaerolineaceae bacterium]